MRVLLIEDQEQLRGAIARRLRAQGHAVDEASDCHSGDFALAANDYSAVVLDRLLPDGDALVQLKVWRQAGLTVPVLMLTAIDGVADRVEGLNCGADDYLVKPFSMDELLARICAVARRGPVEKPIHLSCGSLFIDVGLRQVRRNAVVLPLRPKEYTLLVLLAERIGRVVTRAEILAHCWDELHEPMSNVEEVLVASLRRKLGEPCLIQTVRGAGYVLTQPKDEAPG